MQVQMQAPSRDTTTAGGGGKGGEDVGRVRETERESRRAVSE